MANISEISGDSNGRDPNKKPEELDKKPAEEGGLRRSRRISTRNANRNKKPKKEEDTEEEEKRSVSFPLPNDVTEAIVALIRRCDYPNLSSVCRYFSSLIASSSLYETRARLGLSETFLYATIQYPNKGLPSWHILHRNKASSLRLSELGSLPLVPWGASVVTIGLEMYVIGKDYVDGRRSPFMNVIDCRTHRCRSLPRTKRCRYQAAVGVIDGKIYVIGGFRKRHALESGWIEVFDLEKQNWESLPGPYPKTSSFTRLGSYVVMEDKIYILDSKVCLVYEPKRRGREWDASVVGATPIRNLWDRSSCHQCVVNDMLYTIDPQCTLGSPIVVYDPKEKTWRPVKGESVGRLITSQQQKENFWFLY